MKAFIEDGYTRHVAVGDNVDIPRVEFKYRRPRGSTLTDLTMTTMGGANPQEEWIKLILAHVIWYSTEEKTGKPMAEDLAIMDSRSFDPMVDVIFKNATPTEVLDRKEKQSSGKQSEADAKN